MNGLTGRSEDKPHEHRGRRRRRRRFVELKKNLYWAMIILLIALILGAIVGTSSKFFDKYYGTEEDEVTSMPKDMSKKLKDLDIDKLLRERDRLKR